jgi:hypothetical protein
MRALTSKTLSGTRPRASSRGSISWKAAALQLEQRDITNASSKLRSRKEGRRARI